MAIDRTTIDKINDAARIEEVVGDFVTLKRAGVNLKGLCPFHDDRTPSFVVSPAKNFCHCFACGEGGNPVTFIMKHEQLSYPDALRYLAKKYGIPVEEHQLTEADKQRKDDRESMYILNEWARDWFRHQLNETEDGRAIGLAYFRGRGFRDDILEKFQVGYCPNKRGLSMSADAIKAGYKEAYLVNEPNTRDTKQSIGTGLSFKKDGTGELRDRFFGRVMWPIFTVSGRVAGFGGRVLDAATKGVNIKYQNSPESIIYSKRRELFGLFQAKQAISKQHSCYLVEGYTDVMAMHQSGVENVVASSGTALTEEQISLIHRLTEDIVVIYDGDAAGIKASQRGIDMLLRQGMNVKLLLLPDDDDPDSFARKHTAEEFQTYLKEHQVDFIKFKTKLLMEEAKGDPVGMSRLVNNIVQSIAVIPDEITRVFYIKETAQVMGMAEQTIASAVNSQRTKNLEEWKKEKEREKRSSGLSGLSGNDVPLPQPPTNDGGDEFVPPTIDDLEGKGSSPIPEEVDNEPLVSEIKRTKDNRFSQKEMEIARAIIRYGEQTIGNIQLSDGSQKEMNVITFIQAAMEQDEIVLRTPIYQRVLDEAIKHQDDADFVAEKFFLQYPEPELSELAYKLAEDKEQLSKFHTQKRWKSLGNGESVEEELPQIEIVMSEYIPHILTDYKLAIVKEQIDEVMKEIKSEEILHDMDKYTSVMKRFQHLKEVEKSLSTLRGDRVII